MRALRFGGLLALLFGMNGLAPADTPPATAPTPTVAPTYITVGDIVGEIVKVDAASVTVRVTWHTQPPPKNSPNHQYGNWNRGSSGRNAQQMHQHMMQMQQQLQRQRAQSAQKNTSNKPTEHHQDYVMDFASDATARVQHLAAKLDENGKKTNYTPEEFQKLKGNPKLPGYIAELSDLKAGQLVEAHIVRAPGSKSTKDTKDDMIVRWALILNEDHVGKAATAAKPPAKKK